MARTKQTSHKSIKTLTGSVSGSRDKAPRKRRSRPGMAALREIRHLQKGTKLLIQRAPFERVLRRTAEDLNRRAQERHSKGEATVYPLNLELRFSKAAIVVFQEASEAYLVDVFGESLDSMVHRGAVSLSVSDMHKALHSAQKNNNQHVFYRTRYTRETTRRQGAPSISQ